MFSPSQRRIGITGGIATGKSTVAAYLASKYQLPILDADIYARNAVQPGSSILTEMVNRYGNDLLMPDGSLNRSRLGEIIFNSNDSRLWVESLIHPYVRQKFTQELQELADCSLVILVIPLLFEAQMTDLVTQTWIVYCSLPQQLMRLQSRNHLTLEQALARINAQIPLSQKITMADVVLDNCSTVGHLYHQIDEIITTQLYFKRFAKNT